MTMTTDTQLAELAERCATAAVAAAYPFIGLGAQARHWLDDHATLAVQGVLAESGLLPHLALATCEGARDGSLVLEFPAGHDTDAYVYCDPIDGTLSACRSGPRSYSVVAFSRRCPPPSILALDDSTAIFGVGSQGRDVSNVFAAGKEWSAALRTAVSGRQGMLATLNRLDNLGLLLDLEGLTLQDFKVGSRSGFRPLLGPNCLAVGDATATLPLECALEIGRIGLTEAQVQSGMYRSWTGLIVSRQRIRETAGGALEYLDKYAAARHLADRATLASLFTDSELRRFASSGSDLLEVTTPLSQASFGVGTDSIVVIAALCSDRDPWLPHSRMILEHPEWCPDDSALKICVLRVIDGASSHSVIPVSPFEGNVLPRHLQCWYRTFDWSAVEAECGDSEPWLRGVGEISEGGVAVRPSRRLTGGRS